MNEPGIARKAGESRGRVMASTHGLIPKCRSALRCADAANRIRSVPNVRAGCPQSACRREAGAGGHSLIFRGLNRIWGDLKRFNRVSHSIRSGFFRAKSSKPLMFEIRNETRLGSAMTGDTIDKHPELASRRLLTGVCFRISGVIRASSAMIRNWFRPLDRGQ